MRFKVVLLASVLMAVAFAGCANISCGNCVNIAFQGQGSGSDSKSLECGTSGSIAHGVQGQGSVTVRVTDGEGKEIYSRSFDGQGQGGETDKISGAAGTWTLTVTRGGSSSFGGFGGGFQGQYGITMACD